MAGAGDSCGPGRKGPVLRAGIGVGKAPPSASGGPTGECPGSGLRGRAAGAGAVAPGPSGGGEHPWAPLACWALWGPTPHLWELPARGRGPASVSERVPVPGAASSWCPTQGCHDCFFVGNQLSAAGNPTPFLPFSRPKLPVMDSEGRTCGGDASRWRRRGSRPRACPLPSLPTPLFSAHMGLHRDDGTNQELHDSLLKVLVHTEMDVHASSLSSRPKRHSEASSASLKPFYNEQSGVD